MQGGHPAFPTHHQPGQQQQQQQHAGGAPAAPTFANLGASGGMAFPGTPAHYPAHPQPVHSAQGLSAAIPPSAYLMQQSLLQQQQAAYALQPQPEERKTKREDANHGLILPLHKIKRLIKSESNVKAVSGEASYAIARATELLMETVLERAHQRMVDGGRGSIEYEDIAAVIAKWPATEFLRDAVPETQTLAELIERVRRQDAAKPRPAAAAAAQPQPAPEPAAAEAAAAEATAPQAAPAAVLDVAKVSAAQPAAEPTEQEALQQPPAQAAPPELAPPQQQAA